MNKNYQGRIFQIGVFTGVILFLLNTLENWLSTKLYAVANPFLWRSTADDWWVYFLIFNIIVGLLFVLVYSHFYESIPNKGAGKGLQYGFWVWLVGLVPGMLFIWLIMAVPDELIVVWLVSALGNYSIAGLFTGLTYKPNQK